MHTLVVELLNQFRFADALDIGVVAVLIYIALTWLSERATQSLGFVILVLTAVYALAQGLEMYLTVMMFRYGFMALIFALVVIFQQDIRRGLERFASSKWLRQSIAETSSRQKVDTIAETVAVLAEQRIGALIVFAGREPLERHVRGGVLVDAEISEPLLLSIFHPKSPGHDGAVLIESERIEQLGLHLPLSKNLRQVRGGGTRHAAALGLSECCDALVVAVSEERGTITLAQHGELDEGVNQLTLADRLHNFLVQSNSASTRQPRRRFVGLTTKLASGALAVVLWFLFAYHAATIQRTLVVPVEYRNLPAGLVVKEPKTTRAQVTLIGSDKAFNILDPSSITVSLEIGDAREGIPMRLSTAESLTNVPNELEVSDIVPRTVRVVVGKQHEELQQ